MNDARTSARSLNLGEILAGVGSRLLHFTLSARNLVVAPAVHLCHPRSNFTPFRRHDATVDLTLRAPLSPKARLRVGVVDALLDQVPTSQSTSPDIEFLLLTPAYGSKDALDALGLPRDIGIGGQRQ